MYITFKSRNAKTGDMPVSTSPAATCPSACPLAAGGGCYAAGGPLAMHWRKVSSGERGTDWQRFLASVRLIPTGDIWRHNQAGDLQGRDNKIDRPRLMELAEANSGRNGYTYTHYPLSRVNVSALKAATGAGFVVNVSANSPADADAKAKHGLPVVTLLRGDTDGDETPTITSPGGRKIVVCPATYRDNITCKSCGLCARANRKTIVGFPAHGSGAQKASEIASQ